MKSIVHRDATDDWRAFQIANDATQMGGRVVSITVDRAGLWHIFVEVETQQEEEFAKKLDEKVALRRNR